jgi:tetratricopeptide (TPR) repeat protein
MEAHVAGWLGSALVQLGRAHDALAVTEDAFRRDMHRRGGKYAWFYLFKAIGEAHAALADTEKALAWADRAIQVTQQAGEILHLAQGLKSRGDMRLLLSLSPEEAIDDLQRAKAIAEQHGLLPLAAECNLSLAHACRQRCDREARRFASRAAEVSRRLCLERHLAEAERLAA